jgi:predicted DsbA family dithiol-disulfide isomerase
VSTDEFHSLQVNQRPTFLLENSIGDRAVFSGLARVNALAVALDEILQDEAAYSSWKAHFGEVPAI